MAKQTKQQMEVKNETNEVLPPDLSALKADLGKSFDSYIEGEEQSSGAMVDIVVRLREEIEAQKDNGLTREMVVLTIQEVVADKYSLKLLEVQNKLDKNSKAPNRSKRDSAYVLVSTLSGMAWPKSEDSQKKVEKYIKDTPKDELQFVKIREYSRKKQSNPKGASNKDKITKENFAEKLKAFLVKAQTDLGEKDLAEVLDMAEVTAIPAIRAELEAE